MQNEDFDGVSELYDALKPLRLALVVLSFGIAMAATRSAAASEPSAADRETSRSLYSDGMRWLDAHDYAAAERACGGAHALVKAPTSAACWARALEGLGRLVEARDVFLEAARLPVAPDEPSVFTVARAACRLEAENLPKRIPSVTIVVSGAPSSAPLHVTIDGASVPAETARLPRKMNPGAHAIIVTAPGYEPTTIDVQIGEAEDRRVDVALQLASSVPIDDLRNRSTFGRTRPPALAIVAGGIGAPGLGVGLVAGIAGASKHSTLAGECNGNACPTSAQGDLNSFHTLLWASTIGYVVGALGIAGSVVLWLTAPSSSDPAVGVNIGPMATGVAGTF